MPAGRDLGCRLSGKACLIGIEANSAVGGGQTGQQVANHNALTGHIPGDTGHESSQGGPGGVG